MHASIGPGNKRHTWFIARRVYQYHKCTTYTISFCLMQTMANADVLISIPYLSWVYDQGLKSLGHHQYNQIPTIHTIWIMQTTMPFSGLFYFSCDMVNQRIWMCDHFPFHISSIHGQGVTSLGDWQYTKIPPIHTMKHPTCGTRFFRICIWKRHFWLWVSPIKLFLQVNCSNIYTGKLQYFIIYRYV